jgi:hypothetical protein
MNIKYLESLVTGIKEVDDCRIVLDERGEISEIHVIAATERPPRLIARDVDTILKVRGGVEVDHRKIQVAVIDAPPEADPEPAAGSEAPFEDELIIIEDDDEEDEEPELEESPAFELGEGLPGDYERIIYEKLTVSHSAGVVNAAVQLRRGDQRAIGEHEAADTPDGHLAAVIHATLEAMLMLHESGMRFQTPRFDRLEFGREQVIVVYLESIEERDLHSFTGSAVVRQDLRQAAVLATLSATNRLVGLWAAREQLDFEIV